MVKRRVPSWERSTQTAVTDGSGKAVKGGKGKDVTSRSFKKKKAAAPEKTAPKKSVKTKSRPTNKPKAKKTAPKKSLSNKPMEDRKRPQARKQAGRSQTPGGPTGRVTRGKASVAAGGTVASQPLNAKYKYRLKKGIARDEKKGVTSYKKKSQKRGRTNKR